MHFCDICQTPGNDSGTTKSLFVAIENKFDDSSLPWNNCVELIIGNSNTMIGRHTSIASNGYLSLSLSPYCNQSCSRFFSKVKETLGIFALIFTTGLMQALKENANLLSTLNLGPRVIYFKACICRLALF